MAEAMLQERNFINYHDIYNKMLCSNNKNAFQPCSGDLDGFIVYQLSHINLRPTVETLGLSKDHKPRSPNIHVFDSDILISRAFFSENFPGSILFCAWLESDPTHVIFWEKQSLDGITSNINNKRFVTSNVQNESFKNNSNCHISGGSTTESLVETFQKHNNGNEPSKSSSVYAEETDLLGENFEQHVTRCRIKDFLADEHPCFSKILNDDDDEIDPTETISQLRPVFDEVCALGDAMILARKNRWHNMNKTILNEFKSKWEEAIIRTHEKHLNELISESEWLQAMWLHAIGCPSNVRTKMDLLIAIRTVFSKLTAFSEIDIVAGLAWQGFRPSIAHWIYDRCSSFDSFKEDVLKIATVMPWNSYLCVVDNLVHYTHLHSSVVGTEDVYAALKPTKLLLRVDCDSDSASDTTTYVTRDSILPLALEMENENWTPKDFARSTFDKMKAAIENKSDHYIFGHCCPEQAVISMGKDGLSPLATYKNEFSCGHGMYFFKLDYATLQLTFDELNDMALDNSPVDNPCGLQFRAFVNALLTVFKKPECDAMSVSVLVFLMSVDLEPFDSTTQLLPMCNDNEEGGWKCTCEPAFSIIRNDETRETTIAAAQKRRPTTPNAICQAISMIDRSDIEKVNAFALLGGIVDFSRITNGIYTSIIMDNSPKIVTDSLRNTKDWSAIKFEAWKRLVARSSASFRRPRTFFNYRGGFSYLKPVAGIHNKPQHWSDCPLDPIYETVFVQSAALDTLLQKAVGIFVVFLSPDSAFTLKSSPCHLQDTIATKGYSELYCLAPEDDGGIDDRHRYWKNCSACTCTRYRDRLK